MHNKINYSLEVAILNRSELCRHLQTVVGNASFGAYQTLTAIPFYVGANNSLKIYPLQAYNKSLLNLRFCKINNFSLQHENNLELSY